MHTGVNGSRFFRNQDGSRFARQTMNRVFLCRCNAGHSCAPACDTPSARPFLCEVDRRHGGRMYPQSDWFIAQCCTDARDPPWLLSVVALSFTDLGARIGLGHDFRLPRQESTRAAAEVSQGCHHPDRHRQFGIKCAIRNIHTGGAELRIPHNVSMPQDLLLYVPMDGIGYRSILKWRDGDRAGVAFTGTEPKPRWHYG